MQYLIPILLLVSASELHAQSTTIGATDSHGQFLNESSWSPSLSADGRFLAFASTSTSYVQGDTGTFADIFMKDLRTDEVRRVSTPISPVGDGLNLRPAISGDGRFIVYPTMAKNLFPNDQSYGCQIVIYDARTGLNAPVSVSSAGIQGNEPSCWPAISHDGRFVAFGSSANNLVQGDLNVWGDVFVRDRQTGITKMLSWTMTGGSSNHPSGYPSISGDGRYVVYLTDSPDILPADTNGARDVVLHDRWTGIDSRISQDSQGVQGNNHSGTAQISADGRFVFFVSSADNLVANDTNASSDLFRHEVATGEVIRVNLDSAGNESNAAPSFPTPSADGSSVLFASWADNLTPNDSPFTLNYFLRHIPTGTTQLVDVDGVGLPGLPSYGQDAPAMSADAGLLAFTSSAAGLVPGLNVQYPEVHLRDPDGPSLRVEGTCPGNLTLRVYGGSPGQDVAFLYGPAGSFTQPGGACQGIEVAIANPIHAGTATAGADSLATWQIVLPAGACGLLLQAVDLANCKVTNTRRL